MPIAKIHVLEGRYDERRLAAVSKAVQEALIEILKIPPDDFFQIVVTTFRSLAEFSHHRFNGPAGFSW